MNINQLSYNKLLGIQYMLNQRPRKSLLFQSHFSLFYNFACWIYIVYSTGNLSKSYRIWYI